MFHIRAPISSLSGVSSKLCRQCGGRRTDWDRLCLGKLHFIEKISWKGGPFFESSTSTLKFQDFFCARPRRLFFVVSPLFQAGKSDNWVGKGGGGEVAH